MDSHASLSLRVEECHIARRIETKVSTWADVFEEFTRKGLILGVRPGAKFALSWVVRRGKTGTALRSVSVQPSALNRRRPCPGTSVDSAAGRGPCSRRGALQIYAQTIVVGIVGAAPRCGAAPFSALEAHVNLDTPIILGRTAAACMHPIVAWRVFSKTW